ncbi:T9SS type A sorting domain-containing protein [Hyunsoonleella ulvae]|uniref:T9SS type A sorting domain-containing protein n=1 Tax=Hyunsoonleella ulvae TaxID=2799948 RepID=UPI001939883D|nr:T9SS type A sorting domain-containing protein [Hyunsoonleella ulvae]
MKHLFAILIYTSSLFTLHAQLSVSNDHFLYVNNEVVFVEDDVNLNDVNSTLYFWEQDPNVNSHYITEYDGGYATYTIDIFGVETYTLAIFSMYNSDGTISGMGYGSPSGKLPRRHIPIGQGFMVEGTATGTVKAKNSHRVFEKESSANSEFFKTTNKKDKGINANTIFSKIPEHYKRFRLNIDFNNTYTRQLVETFNPYASAGFDYGMECKINTRDILTSDAYLANNNTSYIAEALVFNENLKIPLTVKVDKNMPIGVRIADIQNFNPEQPIYLHDKNTNLFFDLRSSDYTMNLEEGNHTERFEITFTSNTLSTNPLETDSLYVIQDKNTSNIKIYNPKLLSIHTVTLYDNNGKLILNTKTHERTKTYSIAIPNVSDGIYILKIELTDNTNISKKIKLYK